MLAALSATVLLGCGGAAIGSPSAPIPNACASGHSRASSPRRPPSVAEWRKARGALADLRRSLSASTPHTLRLAVKLREPFTGRVMEARGAVALSPPSALRMILLGPGGTTALDLWASGERFRFAVPAIDLLRRGDASTPRDQMRGLPVDFLRWWLLRPADGTLLWHERVDAGDRFLLRDGAAIVDICAKDGGEIVARRTTWSSATPPPTSTSASAPASADRSTAETKPLDEETVIATRRGCGPVTYTQASTGLSVGVICEGEETSRAPNPAAFIDPDEAARDRDDRDDRDDRGQEDAGGGS